MNTEELTTKMNNLIEVAHGIAKEKGWWDEPRDDLELLLLMQSEIAEALEEYRAHRKLDEVYYDGDKPMGIPIEAADFIIRVADFCGSKGWKFKTPDFEPREGTKRFIPTLFWVNYHTSLAHSGHPHAIRPLGEALVLLFDLYENKGVVVYDLWQAISIKTEYNRTRPFRHGGKKA